VPHLLHLLTQATAMQHQQLQVQLQQQEECQLRVLGQLLNTRWPVRLLAALQVMSCGAVHTHMLLQRLAGSCFGYKPKPCGENGSSVHCKGKLCKSNVVQVECRWR
jgi:hypothetical protein